MNRLIRALPLSLAGWASPAPSLAHDIDDVNAISAQVSDLVKSKDYKDLDALEERSGLRASAYPLAAPDSPFSTSEALARISCANGDWSGSVFSSCHLPATPLPEGSSWREPEERERCFEYGVVNVLAKRRDDRGQPIPLPKIIPSPASVPLNLVN